jgi:hypothetical protein
VPPARFPAALAREFRANHGNNGDDSLIQLRKEYEEAATEAAAERDGDRAKRDRALVRMLECAASLAQRGIYV